MLHNNNVIIAGVALAFFTSLILTGFIIPKILLSTLRENPTAGHEERKSHSRDVPRLGGMAFVPAVIFSVSLVLGIFSMWQFSGTAFAFDSVLGRRICFSLCGLLLLYLVGIADDLVGVLYRGRFMIQLISAVLLVCSGLWIGNLHGLFGVYDWPDMTGILLTILVTLFFVSAINFIDGIDGLASGLSAVALAFYGIVFAINGQLINALISFATLGALVQFFYYNVFGKADEGNKIFMGDTGALCIGFILTYLSVSVSQFPAIYGTKINPIVIAFAPMLVPCFDMLRVIFERIRKGRSPFLPDRTHIHHRLLQLGFTVPKALGIILIISTFYIIVNLLLSPYIGPGWLLIGDLAVWVVFDKWVSACIRSCNVANSSH